MFNGFSKNDRCYIIAEAGVNHNGDLRLVRKLVQVAAQAGADAIKFQTFVPELVVLPGVGKADYQEKNTAQGESQLDMIRGFELRHEDHAQIIQWCLEESIQFLSTPFDFLSLKFLADDLDIPVLKMPSGELTNGPFLLQAARTQKPIIISTGMSTLEEVKLALGVLAYGYLIADEPHKMDSFYQVLASEEGQGVLRDKVAVLHCTSEYPAAPKDINLKVMDTLKNTFGLTTGYSDHSEGIVVPIIAVARGAQIVEKHFTLDKNLPGPDHKASLDPLELKDMVLAIRLTETALGSPDKIPSSEELRIAEVARRSLVTIKSIEEGELFSGDNVSAKRPGTGVSPMQYWQLIGTKASRHYKQNEILE